jgi:hypothetical protein
VSETTKLPPTSDSVPAESRYRPLAITLAILVGLLRLFPHPWNFVPMGAVCLFGGARLRGWRAFAVPLGLMAVSDVFLWLTRADRPFDPFVYASFIACVLLGQTLARTESPWRIVLTAVGGSVLFFLVTNFGAWLQLTNLYPRSAAGLLQSYIAAVPFFRNTFLADLIYTPVLFLAHGLLARAYFRAERVRPETAAD